MFVTSLGNAYGNGFNTENAKPKLVGTPLGLQPRPATTNNDEENDAVIPQQITEKVLSQFDTFFSNINNDPDISDTHKSSLFNFLNQARQTLQHALTADASWTA